MNHEVSRSAEETYKEHSDTVDNLAERDDEIGAIFRALRKAAEDESE